MSVVWDKAVVRSRGLPPGLAQLSPASSSESHGSHVSLAMAVEKILEAGTCMTILLRFGNPRFLLI